MQTVTFIFMLNSIQTPDCYDPMIHTCVFSLKGMLSFSDSEVTCCTCHAEYLQLSDTCRLLCLIWFQVIHIYVKLIVTLDHALCAF
jgi:hypothetical protein